MTENSDEESKKNKPFNIEIVKLQFSSVDDGKEFKKKLLEFL